MEEIFIPVILMMIAMLVIMIIVPLIKQSREQSELTMKAKETYADFAGLIAASTSLSLDLLGATKEMGGGELQVTYSSSTTVDRSDTRNNWFFQPGGGAKQSFIARNGKSFLRSLICTDYLNKHDYMCSYSDSCVELNKCNDIAISLHPLEFCDSNDDLDDIITDAEMAALTDREIIACLQVANYITNRNRYMAQQSEYLSDTLSTKFDRFPP